MALPIVNIGFKTEIPRRTIYSKEKVIEWYTGISNEGKLTDGLSDRKIIRSFLENILPDPQYRAKIVARHPGFLVIESYRWLDTTQQAMSNHLWVISKDSFDYIKVVK